MIFNKWFSQLLDRTILFSFDRTGYQRHCPIPLKRVDLSNQRGIITGASSGIGLAAAKALITQGMDCILIGRNREKVEDNLKKYFHELNIGSLKEVYNFATHEVTSEIDLLVHNAGGMPETLHLSPQGYEEMFASQVLGPFILTRTLADSGKLRKGCKIIFVSSGGMYLQKMDLSDLSFQHKAYNKYTGYANAKRSQIILSEMLSKMYPKYLFSSMHPGWADTPGVRTSMPLFRRIINNRLRTAEEGADTIVWLATRDDYPTGKFWFDRAEAETNLLSSTLPTEEDIKQLWRLCESAYDKTRSS